MASTDTKALKKPEKPKKERRLHPIKYFKDVIGELKKVTWPTRKELISHTGAVFAFVIGMAVLIGALDAIFKFSIDLLA